MKFIIFLIVMLSVFFVFHTSVFAQEQFCKKPVLTSENFDLRVTIIRVRQVVDDKERFIDIGSGFFITDGGKYLYLVSAGHVLKGALKILLDYPGTLVFYAAIFTNQYNVETLIFSVVF